MARLWSCGFELQTITVGMEWRTSTNNAPTIETGTFHGGQAALRILGSSNLKNIQHIPASAQGVRFYRSYFYLDAAPNADLRIFTIMNSANEKVGFRMTSGRALQLFNEEDATQLGSNSSAISTGTWYRLELMVDSTTLSATSIEGRLYGASDESTLLWNPTGTANLTADPNRWRIGIPNQNAPFNIIYDDLAVNDNSGSYQNSWCGEGKLAILRPNAAGDSTQWARGGTDTGENWSQNSETPPDDVITYVESNTNAQNDLYNLTTTPSDMASDATISCIGVGSRFAISATTGADPEFVVGIKAGSTTDKTSGLSGAGSTNWQSYQTTLGNIPELGNNSNYEVPGTSGTWTKADLDSAQVYIEETFTDTHFMRVSALWVYVDYKPGSGGTTTPVSGSDTLSLSISESSTLTTGIAVTDTLSLSISEASSVATSVAPSDSLALSLTESASVVVIPSPSDTLTLSLTESASINVVIDVADNLNLSLTETASVEISAAYDVADNLTLSLTETASVVVSVAVSDSLSISITESGSPAVSVNPSDTTDLSLTEASSVVVSVNPSDNLDISISDTSVITVSIVASDTLSLSLTEAVEVVVSVSVADTLSLSITESSSQDLSVNPNDSLGLGITDTASIAVSVNPSDSLTISLTESGSITLSNDVSASDTLSISLTESASVEIAQAVSASDILSISLTETAQVAVTVSVVDSVSISIMDTATSYGEGTPSDTAGISLTESASVVVSVSVSDNLTISLTEAGVIVATTVAVPISGSDTLTISLTETATIFAVTPPVVLVVRGQLVIYDYYATTLGVGDGRVSMLSIDDSRLYNIVVGDE